MGAKRSPADATLSGPAITIPANTSTDIPISREFGITSDGNSLVVAVRVSSVTNASTDMEIRLQHSSMTDTDGQSLWSDVAGATAAPVTGNDEASVEIRVGTWNSDQLASLPLGIRGRLVATSGSGDQMTVESVLVYAASH